MVVRPLNATLRLAGSSPKTRSASAALAASIPPSCSAPKRRASPPAVVEAICWRFRTGSPWRDLLRDHHHAGPHGLYKVAIG
jgi:transposase